MSTVAVPAARAHRRGLATGVWTFAAVAVGLGAGRAVTTTYVPVLLERIADRPGLIGAVMLVNAVAGFVVPLATGLWSDRAGRRGPFIAGGALLAAGGLVAVALGTASSYAVLALAAATVYVGLNAASTAHRALVAERFAPDGRAAATGAQEGAMLAGALAGTLAGGVLIDASAPALFLLWAAALVVLALPTLAWQRRGGPHGPPPAPAASGASLRLLAEVLRRPGTREVLLAQVLWVGSYAALTPFMVLYAEEVLGLTAASAGVLLAVFGVLTGGGMVAGARLGAERIRGALLAGVALLGLGLLAGTAASSVAQVAVPFGLAAFGAGLVSSVGFPYFSRFIPDGQAGRYAGAFFAARAIAAAAALPAAGLLIQATGSYRWLLGMGALAVAALVPLARAERRPAVAAPAPAARRGVARRPAPAATGGLGSVARTWGPRIGLGMALAWAVAAALPLVGGADERLFLAVNGLGDGPGWLYETFDPHSRNYVGLIATAVLAVLAATRSLRFAAGAFLAMVASAVFADLVMELIQLGVDRPRPEEALGAQAQRSHDRHWSHIPSFPSGHLMVTAGLVATAATLARRLRGPLLLYLGAVAVTRVLFGAHFPLDVVVGAIVGWQVGLFAVALTRTSGLLPAAPAPDPPARLVPASQPA